MSTVCVVPCADYAKETVERALQAALAPLGGLDWVTPGMKIVIKANLVSMMRPESAATTHPALLCALSCALAEKGARVVIGDSPGGLFTAAYVNAVYAATGVRAAVACGAMLNQDFSHKSAQNPAGKVLKRLEYTAYLDDADCVINFCKLKTHGMMGMSACVKNMFGAIPGTYKPEYHYLYPAHSDFAQMLVDINARFPQRLCLVDAVVGMEGNGPTMGKPRAIGALVAADSPYACDRVCARLIGLVPDQLETVQAARARGLEDECTVVGDVDALCVRDFDLVRARKDTTFDHEFNGLLGKLVGGFVRGALRSVPKPKNRLCIGCKKCAGICPAHAIEMRAGKPRIDRKKCICCFCCQEFCPAGAMRVKRPIIAKIFNR